MKQSKAYSVEDLLAYATEHSPFYRELYRTVPRPMKLRDLPIIDQTKFWQAYNEGKLLTGPVRDGIVFKSGGTTGNPKFSVFSQEEWDTFTTVFGRGICENEGIRSGDRVANIFYAGELYASFLFIMRSLDHAPLRSVHFPIAGSTPTESIVRTIKDFDINVIAGVPTSMLTLSSYMLDHGIQLPSVERILYGGEAMYPDQLAVVTRALPGALCQSIGWASVDGGLLGYFGEGCEAGEHRIFSGETVMEVVDEDTGEVIEEEGRSGKLLLTNLTRKLMPIIRYPVGDCGMWSEPPGTVDRKVRLVGRSNEGARIGPATIYLEDVRAVLHEFIDRIPFTAFQLVTAHRDGLDELTVRVGVSGGADRYQDAKDELRQHFYQHRKMLVDLLAKGFIHPLQIEIVPMNQLEKNPRTGKMRPVIDLRMK